MYEVCTFIETFTPPRPNNSLACRVCRQSWRGIKTLTLHMNKYSDGRRMNKGEEKTSGKFGSLAERESGGRGQALI